MKPTPGSKPTHFTDYRCRTFIIDCEGAILELEVDHRRRAEVENAIRDLKHGERLNYLSWGRFPANAAWLAV